MLTGKTDGVRAERPHDRDAVRFEQAAPPRSASMSEWLRKMTGQSPVTPAPPPGAMADRGQPAAGPSSTRSRMNVMSSCCAASPAKACDLAQDALAQLVARQGAVLLDERAEPRLRRTDPRRRSSPR